MAVGEKIEDLSKNAQSIINDIISVINRCESNNALPILLDDLTVACIVTDDAISHNGPNILYANNAVKKLCGYKPEEMYGRTPDMLQGLETDITKVRNFRKELEENGTACVTLINYHKNGAPYEVLLVAGKIKSQSEGLHKMKKNLRIALALSLEEPSITVRSP